MAARKLLYLLLFIIVASFSIGAVHAATLSVYDSNNNVLKNINTTGQSFTVALESATEPVMLTVNKVNSPGWSIELNSANSFKTSLSLSDKSILASEGDEIEFKVNQSAVSAIRLKMNSKPSIATPTVPEIIETKDFQIQVDITDPDEGDIISKAWIDKSGLIIDLALSNGKYVATINASSSGVTPISIYASSNGKTASKTDFTFIAKKKLAGGSSDTASIRTNIYPSLNDFTSFEFYKEGNKVTDLIASGIEYNVKLFAEKYSIEMKDTPASSPTESGRSIIYAALDAANKNIPPSFVSKIYEGFKFTFSSHKIKVCFIKDKITDLSSGNRSVLVYCNADSTASCEDKWKIYSIDDNLCSTEEIETSSIFAIAECKAENWCNSKCNSDADSCKSSEEESESSDEEIDTAEEEDATDETVEESKPAASNTVVTASATPAETPKNKLTGAVILGFIKNKYSIIGMIVAAAAIIGLVIYFKKFKGRVRHHSAQTHLPMWHRKPPKYTEPEVFEKKKQVKVKMHDHSGKQTLHELARQFGVHKKDGNKYAIKDFVRTALREGHSKMKIKLALTYRGWDHKSIKDALDSAEENSGK